ncbi:MAG: alpha/beta hydrolase [Lachnospiraceae bacterium]|uniref:Alpha/beta hydrolase n=1 Tax=Candidatus Weimeria bifida TaxID=2599074 RepID=A0A6N7J2Y6_9FIRM|nr:alpha/beta hydrolase [Candidatus Weimeria bifida]RRF97327.1 MAG: alpha/beta hydrolase [Lachnospiraceae bacterium]
MVIILDGQVINYTHEGNKDGRPLLFLHGNGEDLHIFDELSNSLSDSFDIYRMDSRGHGLSACPAELHYKDMARDVEHFIRELSIDRPLVVGFSDGAITALLLAMTRSELISGVISCGANSSPSALILSCRRDIKKSYREKSASSEIKKDIDTVSSEIFAQSGALEKLMLTEPSISTIALSHIKVPVLVMAGEHDLVRSSDTKKTASAIPDSRLMILPGEDHGSYVVHSTKLIPYIKDFYDQIRS